MSEYTKMSGLYLFYPKIKIIFNHNFTLFLQDFEMNIEEVEEALQHINGHLLTQKECYFLYSVSIHSLVLFSLEYWTVIAACSVIRDI